MSKIEVTTVKNKIHVNETKVNINGSSTNSKVVSVVTQGSQGAAGLDLIDNNIPHAVASGILYFVSQICKLNLGKKDIKLVCGVSEVTINKCYKKLESYKEKLVPKKVMDKYS